jgi:hypothetical protein
MFLTRMASAIRVSYWEAAQTIPKHQTTAALNQEHSGRQIIQTKNLKGTSLIQKSVT